MLTTFLRHLYRDRRRIILALALLLGAVQISSSTLPDRLPGLSTEAMILGLGLVLIPLVTLALPRHRQWIEVVALANLIYAVLAQILPGSAFDFHGLRGSVPLNALAWAGTIAFVRVLLHGTWSDRFTPHRVLRLTTRFRSRAALRDLWYGLIAFPGHIGRYADPEVVSAEYCDPGHRCVRLITWHPGATPGETLVHLDEVRPFAHVRLRAVVTQGIRDAAATGTTEFTFREGRSRRQIVLRFESPAVAPRRMLRAWLDDTVGRIMDQRIRAIERGVDRNRASPVRDPISAWYDEPEAVQGARDDSRGGYRTAHGRALTGGELAVIDGLGARAGAAPGAKPATASQAA